MKRSHTCSTVSLLSAVCFAGLIPVANASADVWSLPADFNLSDGNPAGAWSYGWNDEFEVFSLYLTPASTGINGGTADSWGAYIGGDGTPIVWVNRTPGAINGVPPGAMSLHPGPQGQASVVRWTTPANVQGAAHVHATFGLGDFGAPWVRVALNGSVQYMAQDIGEYNGFVNVSPGDRVEVMVYGAYANCNTPTSITISADVICPADLNSDGIVDGADLGILLGQWNGSGSADLNHDGSIDGADLGALLGAWGQCQ